MEAMIIPSYIWNNPMARTRSQKIYLILVHLEKVKLGWTWLMFGWETTMKPQTWRPSKPGSWKNIPEESSEKLLPHCCQESNMNMLHNHQESRLSWRKHYKINRDLRKLPVTKHIKNTATWKTLWCLAFQHFSHLQWILIILCVSGNFLS